MNRCCSIAGPVASQDAGCCCCQGNCLVIVGTFQLTHAWFSMKSIAFSPSVSYRGTHSVLQYRQSSGDMVRSTAQGSTSWWEVIAQGPVHVLSMA
jgi:hypothetical protein